MPSAEWNATYYAELEKLERIREELKTALTVAQAAEVTRRSEVSIYAAIHAKTVRALKSGGRYFLPRSEVNRMLAETSLF